MPTVRDVLAANFSYNGSDSTSGPLMKLICVWIIENPHQATSILDLATVCGCSERAMYRALRQLVYLKVVAKTRSGSRHSTNRTALRLVKLP
jgi:AraC-like DNA-binding protein